MIKLLQCEYRKTRRRFLLPTALAITAVGAAWSFYGNYSDFAIRNGWLMFLYQLPLANAIFMPLLALIISSRLCDLEHKNGMLTQLMTVTEKGKLFDAKLLYGLAIMLLCCLLSWLATLIFGKLVHFGGEPPIRLYLAYLLFTITPTAAIYTLQHTLAMLFKNQAVPFFVGILGTFGGVFAMFLPDFPFIRQSLIWGYYGALQFVGLYGWTKETRYANAHYEVFNLNWQSFAILLGANAAIYVIGKKIFCKTEL